MSVKLPKDLEFKTILGIRITRIEENRIILEFYDLPRDPAEAKKYEEARNQLHIGHCWIFQDQIEAQDKKEEEKK